MATRESAENPFLQGNFGPWRLEGDAPALEVVGELPRDLHGTYLPQRSESGFRARGAISLVRRRRHDPRHPPEDGRASYRNRWVQSGGLMEERAAGRALYPGLLDLAPTEAPMLKNTANTNIVWHAGKLFALMEAALPTQLRPDTLATVGE